MARPKIEISPEVELCFRLLVRLMVFLIKYPRIQAEFLADEGTQEIFDKLRQLDSKSELKEKA